MGVGNNLVRIVSVTPSTQHKLERVLLEEGAQGDEHSIIKSFILNGECEIRFAPSYASAAAALKQVKNEGRPAQLFVEYHHPERNSSIETHIISEAHQEGTPAIILSDRFNERADRTSRFEPQRIPSELRPEDAIRLGGDAVLSYDIKSEHGIYQLINNLLLFADFHQYLKVPYIKSVSKDPREKFVTIIPTGGMGHGKSTVLQRAHLYGDGEVFAQRTYKTRKRQNEPDEEAGLNRFIDIGEMKRNKRLKARGLPHDYDCFFSRKDKNSTTFYACDTVPDNRHSIVGMGYTGVCVTGNDLFREGKRHAVFIIRADQQEVVHRFYERGDFIDNEKTVEVLARLERERMMYTSTIQTIQRKLIRGAEDFLKVIYLNPPSTYDDEQTQKDRKFGLAYSVISERIPDLMEQPSCATLANSYAQVARDIIVESLRTL